MNDVERCDECGFDGAAWTDAAAVTAIGELPDRWVEATSDVSDTDLIRRPIADMWSIGEYVDHVREVLFGMRFVVDIAVASPETDLGPAPPSAFSEDAAQIDVRRALGGLRREADQLAERLDALTEAQWSSTVRFDGADHDVHWIARHAVHDATHHLLDLDRLRTALA